MHAVADAARRNPKRIQRELCELRRQAGPIREGEGRKRFCSRCMFLGMGPGLWHCVLCDECCRSLHCSCAGGSCASGGQIGVAADTGRCCFRMHCARSHLPDAAGRPWWSSRELAAKRDSQPAAESMEEQRGH